MDTDQYRENLRIASQEISKRLEQLNIKFRYESHPDWPAFVYIKGKRLQATLVLKQYVERQRYRTDFVLVTTSVDSVSKTFRKRTYEPNVNGELNFDNIIKGFQETIQYVDQKAEAALDKKSNNEDSLKNEIGDLLNHSIATRDAETGLYKMNLSDLTVDQVRAILKVLQ